MTMERAKATPEDIAIRKEVFDEAKRLRPMNDLELEAIRDTVLLRKSLPPGTPRPRVTPGAPGTMRATATPVRPRAPSAPGAASSSGQYI